jgi:hypothetical protein
MQAYKSFAVQQSQANGFDPLAMMYGGNIAAACEATNQSVSEGKDQELNADEEKKRQRASNRLTAWQSRERKRIEFEVMKDRKAELTKRNEDLKMENEQLGRVVQQIKEAKRLGGGADSRQTTAVDHAVATSNLSKIHQQQQDQMRFLMPSNRGVLSSLGVPQHRVNAPYLQQGVGPTTFAPLEREQHLQHHQLHNQVFQLGNAPDIASHTGRGALEMPYFRTLAHLSSTKRKDAAEESTPDFPNKRSRKELTKGLERSCGH